MEAVMKNVIRLLKDDHAFVKKLFRQYERADKPADLPLRADLFRQINDELTLHTRLEEEIVYPALEDLGTEVADAYHGDAHEDHEEVKRLLYDLNHVDPGSDRFDLDMKRVILVVERHIEEEEEGILPYMERRLNQLKLDLLGEEIEERKHALA